MDYWSVGVLEYWKYRKEDFWPVTFSNIENPLRKHENLSFLFENCLFKFENLLLKLENALFKHENCSF